MPELFGIDIAGLVADATEGQLRPAIITVRTTGARDPNKLTGGQAKQDNPHECDGMWVDFTTYEQDTEQVEVGDRKALLIAGTMPSGIDIDDIVAVTIDGETMAVVRLLASDPAQATYTFQCRGRSHDNR